MSLAPGTLLGPYEILALIGAGGMGEVYRARDPRLDRQVAVKVLSERWGNDQRSLSRFEREAKAVAALSHPHILTIYDVGSRSGMTYVVTELLDGETVRARLARGPLEWRKAVEICIAVAEGLDAAHGKGVVHRDVKPENIFLTSDGRVKILDFGLASYQPAAAAGQTLETQTEVGLLMGTPGYMSPEQVRGEPVNAASDIFSLGCVLYELLTGRRAFVGPTVAASMAAILSQDPPIFTDAIGNAPTALERLVRHCLEKDCRLRFHSAHDLVFAMRNLERPQESAQAGSDSIAVLPFTNAGGADSEYLSDGITESLINIFSSFPRLRVVPRSVAFRYKGVDVDPRATGYELNVRLLLTGRVLQRGERLSVQAELVDTREQKQIWGERFNRTFSDIFEVEDEIARKISDQLRTKLTGEDRKRLGRRYTENTTAYQLYLKGSYQLSKRTPESLQRAIAYFQAATGEDPQYGLAYAGLADGQMILSWYGLHRPAEAIERSKNAALRAVEMDGELAEGYAALGFARVCGAEWAAAIRDFERAIQLNPGCWQAYDWYALCLSFLGRCEEAVSTIGKAQQLEPLSLVIYHHSAWVHLQARRYNEALAQCRKAFEIAPDYSLCHFWAGLAYSQMSMHEDAIRSLQRAREYLGNVPFSVAGLAHAYVLAGEAEKGRKLLDQLAASDQPYFVDPYQLAVVHAGLGDRDVAFRCLEEAYRDHSGWLAGWAYRDPRLDPLRGDARFADLLRRLGVLSLG
jgi:serine/threonine protein kinase/Flp pilus assembly protein TadD